jgi:hypothetical protein
MCMHMSHAISYVRGMPGHHVHVSVRGITCACAVHHVHVQGMHHVHVRGLMCNRHVHVLGIMCAVYRNFLLLVTHAREV